MKVWMDGEVMDGAQARIPVTDHGLLYGDGIFEGIRVYSGRVFALDRHLSRLAASARSVGLDLPLTDEELTDVIVRTAAAFGQREAYVRLIVTRGDGPLGVDPTVTGPPRVICMVSAISLYDERKLHEGLALITSSLRRPSADVLDPRVKSLNYLNSVLAKREARLRGADEALLLNQAGHIAEASVANLFVVRGGTVLTPPTTDGALEGVTRGTILELAGALGIPAAERTLTRADLFRADEAFLTGTGARIVPIASLDGSALPTRGMGPITTRLEAAFTERTREGGVPVFEAGAPHLEPGEDTTLGARA